MVLLGELAAALAASGRYGEAKTAIAEALERAERHEERWYQAELMRIQGRITLLEGAPDAALRAEQQFAQALACARGQKVLSFELRAATSLARLHAEQGLARQARDELLPVVQRFTEGLKCADLVEAKQLLDQLG